MGRNTKSGVYMPSGTDDVHTMEERLAASHSIASGSTNAAASPGVLSRMDWLGMLGGFLFCLICSYAFGYKRIFWEDEMLGWMMVHDPSFRHMLTAWNLGADGGGMSFYLTCRAWFHLFGASELSFRFYSATCFGAAFVICWVTARRYFNTGVVALSLFSAWFLSPPLVSHLAEGRFYGLLMLATASVAWLTLVKSRDGKTQPLVLCGLAFLLNGVLITSHVLGILYSATLLAALVLLDWRSARLRPLLYFSTMLAWLLLIPERTAIRATTDVGKPYFWTSPPTLSRFFGAYCEFSAAVALLMFLLVILLILSRRGGRAGVPVSQRLPAKNDPVLLTSGILFLLPVVLTIQAHFGTSLFINRYLMPLTVPQAFLLCELISRISWTRLIPASFRSASRTFGWIAAAGYAAVMFTWIFGHLIHFAIGANDFTKELTAKLPKGVPVLCEDAWVFTQIIGRQHASGVQYTYLLDWQQSTSASAPRLEVTQYHLMENWRKAGYFAGSITPIHEFLQQHDQFLILHWNNVMPSEVPVIGDPLLARFRDQPSYQVKLYRHNVEPSVDVWLVCRGTCPSASVLK